MRRGSGTPPIPPAPVRGLLDLKNRIHSTLIAFGEQVPGLRRRRIAQSATWNKRPRFRSANNPSASEGRGENARRTKRRDTTRFGGRRALRMRDGARPATGKAMKQARAARENRARDRRRATRSGHQAKMAAPGVIQHPAGRPDARLLCSARSSQSSRSRRPRRCPLARGCVINAGARCRPG